MSGGAAPFQIIKIELDRDSIATRTPEIEVERHRAISDLLDENSFRLVTEGAEGAEGPYRLRLAFEGLDRLLIQVNCTQSGHQEEIPLPLSPLKRLIADYTIICDNFYRTAKAGEMHRLEAIDMGRRGIHNEGAEVLAETLENKVIVDKTTARRLFSLLYVLHMRSTTTIT